jgi:hypothetical protein
MDVVGWWPVSLAGEGWQGRLDWGWVVANLVEPRAVLIGGVLFALVGLANLLVIVGLSLIRPSGYGWWLCLAVPWLCATAVCGAAALRGDLGALVGLAGLGSPIGVPLAIWLGFLTVRRALGMVSFAVWWVLAHRRPEVFWAMLAVVFAYFAIAGAERSCVKASLDQGTPRLVAPLRCAVAAVWPEASPPTASPEPAPGP